MNRNGSGGGVAVSIIEKDGVLTCNAWAPLALSLFHS